MADVMADERVATSDTAKVERSADNLAVLSVATKDE